MSDWNVTDQGEREPFSAVLAKRLRERPLPQPSDASTDAILAAARQQLESDPNAQTEDAGSDTAWHIENRRSRWSKGRAWALAVAACVALALLPWLSINEPGSPPPHDDVVTGLDRGSHVFFGWNEESYLAQV